MDEFGGQVDNLKIACPPFYGLINGVLTLLKRKKWMSGQGG